MHRVDDLLVCFSKINGHVGRHIDRFDGADRQYGVNQRNLEGIMPLA